MKILDELKTSANIKQSLSNGAYDQISNKQYHAEILPKMQQIYSYFNELFNYLDILESKIEIENYCNHLPALGTLEQHNYRLKTDEHGDGGAAHFDNLTEINLLFNCKGINKNKMKGKDELIYTVYNRVDAEKEHRTLTNCNIPYKSHLPTNDNAEGAVTFRIKRNFPVLFKFLVETEKSRILLSIKNHENFEESTRYLKPEQINEDFLDKLGRYILRKDNDFRVVKTNDTKLDNIRETARIEREEKENLNKILEDDEKLEQQKIKENKMGYKFKSFIRNKFTPS